MLTNARAEMLSSARARSPTRGSFLASAQMTVSPRFRSSIVAAVVAELQHTGQAQDAGRVPVTADRDGFGRRIDRAIAQLLLTSRLRPSSSAAA